VPQVEVSFNIDANGILNVTAKDKASGKEQSITIKDSGNLDKEDIAKAQKEAEVHADEDKQKRAAVEAKNTLSTSIYSAEKMKDEYKDKLSDDDKKTIDEAVTEAKKHEAEEDKDKLETAAKALNDAIMPIGAKLYEAADAKKDEAADKQAEKEDSKDKKKGDEPVEGEVVDEKK
jgi:molecular chaperone DnaK